MPNSVFNISEAKQMTMGDIASVVSGGTPSTTDEKNYQNGDIAWITPADLSKYEDKYIGKGRRNITRQGLNSSSARMLPKGTVLFSSRAPIGYVAIAANEVCTNQGFKSFVLSDKVLPEYVYWWLKSIKDLAEKKGSGTVFAELSKPSAEQLPFLFVPMQKQREIVARIESLFGRLDKVRATVIKTKEKAKTCMENFLFSIFGESDAPRKLIGEICQKSQYGWTTKAVHNAGEIKLLRTTDITSGTVNWDSVPYCTSAPDDIKKYLLKSGDILISRAGSVGVSMLMENPQKAVFASYLIRFIPKTDIVLAKYLYLYLQSPVYWDMVESQKSGITLPNLNAAKISKMPVPVPSLAEQKRIVIRAESVLSKIGKARKFINSAQRIKIKDSLLYNIVHAGGV